MAGPPETNATSARQPARPLQLVSAGSDSSQGGQAADLLQGPPLRRFRALEGIFVVHDSLSLILPVRNAEGALAERVSRLLDLLPDLTSRFEIVVVDDGSTDQTADVARELVQQYPQLRLIRHDRPRGLEAAAQTGLQSAAGTTVLVQEDAAPPSPAGLRRLWSLRHDPGVVMARTQQRPVVFEPELLQRLSTWGEALRELAKKNAAGGVQMIRRDGARGVHLAALRN